MSIIKSIALFVLAALAKIGGAWLVWQSVKEAKPWWWAGLGIAALGIYGFVAAFQPDAHFGRVLAAYGSLCSRRGRQIEGHRAGTRVMI
jgi:small multidrug resistance family-3 protein